MTRTSWEEGEGNDDDHLQPLCKNYNRYIRNSCCTFFALWRLADKVRVMVMDVGIICFKWVTGSAIIDWAVGRLTLGNLRNPTDRVSRRRSDERWWVWW